MKEFKNQIEKYIDDGLLFRRWHSTGELQIINYSQKVQYDRLWDDLTLQSRGIILTKDYQLVSRPLKKFFNIEEVSAEEIPNEPFEVYEKIDGSALILYFIDDNPFVATRGSFESEQANWGNEILYKKYSHCFDKLRELKEQNITAVWELLHPQNRIVVDYGNIEDMILLALIDNKTGLDVPLKDIGFPIVKRYDGINDFTKIKNQLDADKEGFVIKFKNHNRIKLKHAEYCRLHKIITQTSNLSIWEALKNNTPLDEMLERVPDEFFSYFRRTKEGLENQYSEMEQRSKEKYKELECFKHDKKAFALRALSEAKDISSILFNMRDGKDYSKIIWKQIRPEFQKPFRENTEV